MFWDTKEQPHVHSFGNYSIVKVSQQMFAGSSTVVNMAGNHLSTDQRYEWRDVEMQERVCKSCAFTERVRI